MNLPRGATSWSEFGLIGDPVAHSLSPPMYEAAFRALDLGARYRLLRVPRGMPGAIEHAMRDLARTGGGNVTLPHKEEAAAVLDVALEDVVATGACNCFWGDDRGRVVGDNTDVGGILRALRLMQGLELAGARVLVLGAGGAARAAVVALARTGIAEVAILNRTPSRARTLASALDDRRIAVVEPPVAPGDFDLVVQATRLGLKQSDSLPIGFAESHPGHALDLVYRPGGTHWVDEARARGVVAEDGLGVLLEQGLLSLERWLGRPPPAEVRTLMQRALSAHSG